jgi:hypothetical protein
MKTTLKCEGGAEAGGGGARGGPKQRGAKAELHECQIELKIIHNRVH